MKDEERERFERLADIQARIAELKVAEEELVAEIVEMHGVGERTERVGGRIPVVEQPKKYSAKDAIKVLAGDPVRLKSCLVESWTLPAAVAKEKMTPEELERCYINNGKPKVKFKEVKE